MPLHAARRPVVRALRVTRYSALPGPIACDACPVGATGATALRCLSSAVTAATVGASVVLAVHYGRGWAEGVTLSANASNQRDVVLAVCVVAGSFALLALGRVRRWRQVPFLAFPLQGAAMFVLEHSDGFWLPLWLDLIVGAATWALVAVVTRQL